jgi:DNA modification methylase
MPSKPTLAYDSAESHVESSLTGDAIHQWYQIIMGFDWKLVHHIIDHLSIGPDHLVLDPFCGAGTTLVQCKKQGIRSVGIDANPVCTLASQVKTSWRLSPERLSLLLDEIISDAAVLVDSDTIADDPALAYLQASGMIERGWLSLHKARRILAVNTAIKCAELKPSERKFFRLALLSAVVDRIADIKFGPEVYCLPTPKRTHVFSSFAEATNLMIRELREIRESDRGHTQTGIILGDSRKSDALKAAVGAGADFIITSPPYPAEHDYTRSTRLELILLGCVQSTDDLRPVKKRMLRCHTKGIYKDDDDAAYSSRYKSVQKIARSLDRRAKGKTDGFSRLYGRMVREYFGGMICHLRQAHDALKSGGRCAYVIRDQQSLSGLYIDTPRIIADIAQSRSQGFKLEDIIEWKRAKGTTGKRTLSEKIIFLRKS